VSVRAGLVSVRVKVKVRVRVRLRIRVRDKDKDKDKEKGFAKGGCKLQFILRQDLSKVYYWYCQPVSI
jgi:hypothetical protein